MARQYGPKDPFKLIVNRAALNHLLNDEDSPIALDLAKKAQRVAASAKRRAPKKTGRLKASIRFNIDRDEQGLYADVGSTEPYSRFVETGHKAPDNSRVSPRRYLRPALRSLRRGKRPSAR